MSRVNIYEETVNVGTQGSMQEHAGGGTHDPHFYQQACKLNTV